MIESVEELKSPPEIGKTYLVPCMCGKAFHVGSAVWWPVLRPSHEDSKYVERQRTHWKECENRWSQIDETYYEADPDTPHHIHVDPRFAPASLYTAWERENGSWHNFITVESGTEWREMECLREMPVQRLFTGFGRRFVKDHQKKRTKCGRCPHKGALLESVPVVDGIVTCPLHGLQFDATSGECVTR